MGEGDSGGDGGSVLTTLRVPWYPSRAKHLVDMDEESHPLLSLSKEGGDGETSLNVLSGQSLSSSSFGFGPGNFPDALEFALDRVLDVCLDDDLCGDQDADRGDNRDGEIDPLLDTERNEHFLVYFSVGLDSESFSLAVVISAGRETTCPPMTR